MGDAADMALEQMMSLDEYFIEHGEECDTLDDPFLRQPPVGARTVQCRYCQTEDLVWRNTGTDQTPAWRLHTKGGVLHLCQEYWNKES